MDFFSRQVELTHHHYECRVGDFVAIGALLWTAQIYIPFIDPHYISLPHPALYGAARFAAWGAYTFAVGLLFMGLFVLGHEAGKREIVR